MTNEQAFEIVRIVKSIISASQFYNVPITRTASHCWQESRWNELGTNLKVHSPSGHGKGVMQIDDRWHKFAQSEAVWDTTLNIFYGSYFLSHLYSIWGSWKEASKAYNGSGSEADAYEAAVETWMEQIPWKDCVEEAYKTLNLIVPPVIL